MFFCGAASPGEVCNECSMDMLLFTHYYSAKRITENGVNSNMDTVFMLSFCRICCRNVVSRQCSMKMEVLEGGIFYRTVYKSVQKTAP